MDMDLINLALDTGDKEWFNKLAKECKLEEQNIKNNIRSQTIINTALEKMPNDTYAIKTDKGIRIPISLEDLEKYPLIKVSSKRDNAIEIFTGEETNINELSKEEKYIYKICFQQYNKGFNDAKNMYYKYFQDSLKLEKQVEDLVITNKLLSESNKILLDYYNQVISNKEKNRGNIGIKDYFKKIFNNLSHLIYKNNINVKGEDYHD